MDRGPHQPQPQQQTSNAPAASKKQSRLQRIKQHRLLNITYLTLLFSITVLIVGVVLSIFLFDGNKNKESELVDNSKYQAVFLNGGQVYFGKVTDVNSKYLSLADIYYLTPNQAVQSDSKNGNAASNNFTIRKLGCELHRPQDVMVVNHDQIIFWENLKDDSSQNTVPGAIKQLAKQPQNCEQQTSGSTDNSSNANTSNTNSDSTPAANTNSSTSNGQ